jgi:tetratricopeptide (TPR) repeat protein
MRSLLPTLLLSFTLTVPALSLAASAPPAAPPFEAIAAQAEAARAQDRVADAIRLYRAGTQLRSAWSDGWWYLGSLLYDQDRFSEADAAFQHLLSSPAHRSPAYAFLGLCEYGTGNYNDALTHFRAWAGAGWTGSPELRDVAVFHFALLLTRDGRFVESLYLLASAAPRLGDLPELSEAMGLASLHMRYLPENFPPEEREPIWLAGKAALYAAQTDQQFDRADEFAARLESRYGAKPGVHSFRATLYGFELKKAEAESEYRAELKISPNDVSSMVALALIDFEKGELSEADGLARRALDADSKDAEAHHVLGRELLAKGDLNASLSELETAKQLAPGNPTVRSHLAMVLSKLGRTQEAKAESAAFVVLKNKEDVMASVEEKLGEKTPEKAH